MNAFTVVLLYPDYLTDDFGADVYVDSTETEDFHDAVRVVQEIAIDAQAPGLDLKPGDFRPMLVLQGNVKVVADACSF